jgi:hypothetical protein
MVCTVCGGTAFDEQGICLRCGAHTRVPDVTPARVALSTTPKPKAASPAPSPLVTAPHAEDDPAGTNPSSGQFCGRCGSAVDATSDYCGICGNPLNDDALQRVRAERAQAQRAAVMHLTPPVARALSATGPPRPRVVPPAILFVALSIIAAIVIGLALGVLIIHNR